MGGRGGRGGGTGPGWRNPGMDGGAVGYQGATKKIFIGGIGHGTTEDDIKAYFQTYGNVSGQFSTCMKVEVPGNFRKCSILY